MTTPQSAQDLRAQALDLLNQAMAMDEMGPYLVTHGHSQGFRSYILWAPGTPSVYVAVQTLEIDFHPELGETITIEPTFSLEDFTCQFPNRMITELESLESDAQSSVERPRGG